ncbi:hypothetical protein [Nocardioides pakistanensis]
MASTARTPGRRPSTASATFLLLAQWTPDSSSTAVDALLSPRPSGKYCSSWRLI